MCLNIKKITGLNTQVHPPVIIQLSSNQTKELTEFMSQYVTTFGSMTFERRLFPSRGGRFEQTQSAACFRLCLHSDDSPPARMKEKYHISNIFKCLSNFPTRHWVGISMQDISNPTHSLPPPYNPKCNCPFSTWQPQQ